ncbi:venom protease-like, partial [Ceratina calcarata]|uniref:Venom protease-like n=1 Tax=Ceratina calcarata TaxID=156304 RepID=A0AAJ7NCL5_9HYME
MHGNESQPGEWPWMVALGYEDETHPLSWRCGGSLITSRHVLTAAHCVTFTTPSLKYVRLGDIDLTCPGERTHAITIAVEKKIKHPCYNPVGKYMNDIAVLRLSEDVTFTDLIRPVCLPLDHSFQKHSFVGSHTYVVGCGRTTL